MRIIGPPYYKPEVTCLEPPFPSDNMRAARLAKERRIRLQAARREREDKLRCPDCGDSLKVRIRWQWRCRHCLGFMA